METLTDVFEWAAQFSPVCTDHIWDGERCGVCEMDQATARGQAHLLAFEQAREAELERRANMTPVEVRRWTAIGVMHIETEGGPVVGSVCRHCGEMFADGSDVHLCYSPQLQA